MAVEGHSIETRRAPVKPEKKRVIDKNGHHQDIKENLKLREMEHLRAWLPRVGPGYGFKINADSTYSLTYKGEKLNIHIKKADGLLEVAQQMEQIKTRYLDQGMKLSLEGNTLFVKKGFLNSEKIRIFDQDEFAFKRKFTPKVVNAKDMDFVNDLNIRCLRLFYEFMNTKIK